MPKRFYYFLLVIFLLGCSVNGVNDHGEFRRDFNTNMVFLGQYEIIYKVKVKDKEVDIVSQFLADSDKYLPERVERLHYGLSVANPNERKFEVWVKCQHTDLDTNHEFLNYTKLVHESQGLSQEFVSIELPFHTNIHSKIVFSVKVVDEENATLFESAEALYKIKGEEKT